MMDIDIEEIDYNSSQEDCPPATTVITTTKKRTTATATATATSKKSKSKKESPAVASSASTLTLTRFLGPAGPPSLSAWEDVNRQCPVCQQTGFSSRSLALHVNECLDVGSKAGAGAGAGTADDEGEGEAAGAKETTKRVLGAARGRNAPTPGSARRAGNVRTSNASHAAGEGEGGGEAVARQTPRVVPLPLPSKSRASASGGKVAKKAKTQQGGRGAAAERQRPDPTSPASRGCGQAANKAKSGASSIQPGLLDAKQSPAGVAQQQQQPQATPLRRRGLGLARPTKVQPTGGDDTPTPTAAAAVSRVPTGSNERVLNEIARAQLSYVVEASGRRSASASQAGVWLGTQLFPKPDTEGSLRDDQCADCRCDGTAGEHVACLAECGANANADFGKSKKFVAHEKSRVRGRPASWGARTRPTSGSEQRGWRGIWPGGMNDGKDDDCWGDGDGYLTLRPFPSVADPTPTPTGEDAEDASTVGSGNVNNLAVQAGDSQSLSSRGQGGSSRSPAPTSRADRFLQVFTRLQPARRALNLHESPAPSPQARPKPKPKPKPKQKEARCAEVDGAGARLSPRVVVGDSDDGDADGRRDIASAGRKHSMTASPAVELEEGGAKVWAGGAAGSCEGGSVGKVATPLPKRAALRTLTLPSAGVTSTADQRSSANNCIVPDRRRAAPSSSSHCNSLGPTSTSTSLNKVSRKGPPKPPSPTPAVPPTSEIEKTSGIGRVASNPLANSKGSVEQAAASVPRTSHLSGATSVDVEIVATGTSKRPKPASVTRTQLSSTLGRGGGEPAPRDGGSGNSGRMIGRLAGASVTVKRASTSRESRKWDGTVTPMADGSGDPQAKPDGKHDTAAPVSRRRAGPRSQGPLACRASSGLLRSADCAGASGSGPTSACASGIAEPNLVPATGGRFVESSASDVSEQEQEQRYCQGRQADVPQKGSLTVVCNHGATLRSSWSIDDSQEVGRLVFGASLDYDAVWCLDPADEDCVGVRRYRMLPHPLLAPTGGWISERGRLRDDPYTIVKATPSPTSTSCSSSSSSPSSSSRTASSDRYPRGGPAGGAGAGAGGTEARIPLGRRHPGTCTPHPHHQQQSRNGGLAKITSARGSNTKTNTSTGRGRGRGSTWYPIGESHDERASAPATSATARLSAPRVDTERRTRPKPQTASKVFASPGTALGRGSFGIATATATSPSAKALETNDTGDKVTCPVCNRGMDHWKSGQRQQHVHSCLLKQSSSAKKTPLPSPSPAAAAVTPASRTPDNDTRYTYVGAGGSGSGKRARSGVEEAGPAALGPEGRQPPGSTDMVDSPRSTRVSLQGMFSPKPLRGPRNPGHGPGQSEHRRERESTPRGSSASAASPRTEPVTPTRKSGAGVSLATKTTGFRGSRGAAQVDVQVSANKKSTSMKTVAPNSKGPAECPVCQLHFGDRLADWERQQHIQQCLESLEGVFGSEE